MLPIFVLSLHEKTSMRFHLFFLFVLLNAVCYSQKAIKNKEKTILLEYGFPCSDDCNHERDSIAKIWGIEYNWIQGCTTTSKFRDSVSELNQNSIKKWNAKHAMDWESYLSQKLDSIHKVKKMQEEAFKLAESKKYDKLKAQLKTSNISLNWKLNKIPLDSTIYLGFDNELNFLNEKGLKITSENCFINQQSDSVFLLRPGMTSSRKCTLFVYQQELLIHLFEFHIKPFPVANFCFGKQSIFDFSTNQLGICNETPFYKYNQAPKILSHEINLGSKSIKGVGNEISSECFEEIIKMDEGDSIQIYIKYKGMDCIIRSALISLKVDKFPEPTIIISTDSNFLQLTFPENKLLEKYIQLERWSAQIDGKIIEGNTTTLPPFFQEMWKENKKIELTIEYKNTLKNTTHSLRDTIPFPR